ncbi:MAG: hypothetical protein LBI82_10470 [Dysgonamonadaceae bacterium]|nr:hypothetical protein [Dysgonamonadaceae bacterium]
MTSGTIYYLAVKAVTFSQTGNYSFIIESPSLTSIISVVNDDKQANIIGYYNFAGQRLSQEPERGFYIVVYDNGTTKKIAK